MRKVKTLWWNSGLSITYNSLLFFLFFRVKKKFFVHLCSTCDYENIKKKFCKPPHPIPINPKSSTHVISFLNRCLKFSNGWTTLRCIVIPLNTFRGRKILKDINTGQRDKEMRKISSAREIC